MSYIRIALLLVPIERHDEHRDHSRRLRTIRCELGAAVADDHRGIELSVGGLGPIPRVART